MRPIPDRLGILLFLFAGIALAYAPGLKAPPAYDDPIAVLGNPAVSSLGTALGNLFRPIPPVPPEVPAPGYAYRPLTEISFALNPGGIQALRIGNLLIHAASCFLVFLIARRLLPDRPSFAGWAAFWFALHPLGVQAVTYLSQRFVGLQTLMMLLTLWLYIGRRYRLAWIAGLLAMTTKETAVTLPLLLAAYEWIRKEPGESAWPAFKRWLPFAALPLLVVVQILRANAAAPPGVALFAGESRLKPFDYLLVELPILVRYLSLNALPFPLRFYYDRPSPGPDLPPVIPWGETAFCGILLLGGIAWILFGPARQRLARLGLALFFAPLALESSVFPIADPAFNHRCYPGLLGTGVLFALAAVRLPRILPGLTLVLMVALTAAENRVWSDTGALLRRDVRHAFHDGPRWGALGWRYLEAGHPEAAQPLFRQGMKTPWQTGAERQGYARAVRMIEGRRPGLRGRPGPRRP